MRRRAPSIFVVTPIFHEAVLAKGLSFAPPDGAAGVDGAMASTLTRHVLNARRREGRMGITISKEYPRSPKKIDAAMAAVLAYEARADAVASGVRTATANTYMPRRLR